jgi:hypothetical protein
VTVDQFHADAAAFASTALAIIRQPAGGGVGIS